MDLEAANLEALILLMRKHGVMRVRATDHANGGLIEVELGPSVAVLGQSLTREVALGNPDAPEKCRCGHEEHAHGVEGLCLLGCEPHICDGRARKESAMSA